MGTPVVEHADVAAALAEVLSDIPGVRVYPLPADKARPPCILLNQPEVLYNDPETPFCFATYTYPLTVVTMRNQDQDAYDELSRLVFAIARTLHDAEPAGVFSVEPLTARPQSVALNGQELPGYVMSVRIRA